MAEEGSEAQWQDGLGDWIINEDGSMNRLVPVSEDARRMARERGVVLAPDHVPADAIDHYYETRRTREED